jgi:hypothetical protein
MMLPTTCSEPFSSTTALSVDKIHRQQKPRLSSNTPAIIESIPMKFRIRNSFSVRCAPATIEIQRGNPSPPQYSSPI